MARYTSYPEALSSRRRFINVAAGADLPAKSKRREEKAALVGPMRLSKLPSNAAPDDGRARRRAADSVTSPFFRT
jgi:hypothetical protein